MTGTVGTIPCVVTRAGDALGFAREFGGRAVHLNGIGANKGVRKAAGLEKLPMLFQFSHIHLEVFLPFPVGIPLRLN